MAGAQMKAQRDLANPNLSISTPLYTQPGVRAALQMWGEFENLRHQYEQGADEDDEQDRRDESWGRGELEE